MEGFFNGNLELAMFVPGINEILILKYSNNDVKQQFLKDRVEQ